MPSVETTIHQGLATLTLNRPQVHNALDLDAMTALHHAVAALESQPEIRAVVLTGSAGAFCSGGDLRALSALTTFEDAYAMSMRMQRALAALEGLPVPVVAAVTGPALGGGCEVLLATHVRVMEDHTYLSFKQLQMAVTHGWGGAARLARDVGPRQAFRLMLQAEKLSAVQALDLHLVDEVVPQGQGLPRALELARQYAALPPLAVTAAKRMLMDEPARMHREATLFAGTWASRDHQEAVNAFWDKRPPQWEGR